MVCTPPREMMAAGRHDGQWSRLDDAPTVMRLGRQPDRDPVARLHSAGMRTRDPQLAKLRFMRGGTRSGEARVGHAAAVEGDPAHRLLCSRQGGLVLGPAHQRMGPRRGPSGPGRVCDHVARLASCHRAKTGMSAQLYVAMGCLAECALAAQSRPRSDGRAPSATAPRAPGCGVRAGSGVRRGSRTD